MNAERALRTAAGPLRSLQKGIHARILDLVMHEVKYPPFYKKTKITFLENHSHNQSHKFCLLKRENLIELN